MEAIITHELTTSTTLILCPPSHCTLPVGLKQLVIFSHVLSRRRWDYFYFCATSITYMECLGALKVPSHYHHHHHHHHHHRRRRRRRDFFSSHPYCSPPPPFGLNCRSVLSSPRLCQSAGNAWSSTRPRHSSHTVLVMMGYHRPKNEGPVA